MVRGKVLLVAVLLAALPLPADAAFVFRHWKGGGPVVASFGGACASSGVAYRGRAFPSTAGGGYSSSWRLTGAPAYVSMTNAAGVGTLAVSSVPPTDGSMQAVTFTVTETLVPSGFGEMIDKPQTVTLYVGSVEGLRIGLGESYATTCAPVMVGA